MRLYRRGMPHLYNWRSSGYSFPFCNGASPIVGSGGVRDTPEIPKLLPTMGLAPLSQKQMRFVPNPAIPKELNIDDPEQTKRCSGDDITHTNRTL
jgi:hypothetical protein